MAEVISKVFIIRSTTGKSYVEIDKDTAFLACFKGYMQFRPAYFLNTLDKLEEKLKKEGLSLSSKLETNFDIFVISGYVPAVLEQLFDRKFNYNFSYVLRR